MKHFSHPYLTKEFRRKLEVPGGFAVAFAACYFLMEALRGLNLSDILSAGINWPLACLSSALFAAATLVRALAYPLGIEPEMTVTEAWQVVAIGNAANMLLPFRAGEGVRLAVFPARYGAAERAELSTVPGMADLAVMLLMTFAAVYIADFRTETYMSVLRLCTYGFIAACALALLILIALPVTRPRVFAYLNRGTLAMLCWVVLSWLVTVASMWVAFLAFGYRPLQSVMLTFGAYAGTTLVCLIPSSPGNLGIFEYAVVLGLAGLGVSRVQAQTAGLLLHVIQYAGVLPLGGILYARYLWRRGRAAAPRRRYARQHGRLFAGAAGRALLYKK